MRRCMALACASVHLQACPIPLLLQIHNEPSLTRCATPAHRSCTALSPISCIFCFGQMKLWEPLRILYSRSHTVSLVPKKSVPAHPPAAALSLVSSAGSSRICNTSTHHLPSAHVSPFAVQQGQAGAEPAPNRMRAQRATDRAHNDAVLSAAGTDEQVARSLAQEDVQVTTGPPDILA